MKKKFKAMLLLNWKTGNMRILKRVNIKKLSPWEIPVDIDINVIIPEKQVHKAAGTIELSDEKVSQLTLEALDEL